MTIDSIKWLQKQIGCAYVVRMKSQVSQGGKPRRLNKLKTSLVSEVVMGEATDNVWSVGELRVKEKRKGCQKVSLPNVKVFSKKKEDQGFK